MDSCKGCILEESLLIEAKVEAIPIVLFLHVDEFTDIYLPIRLAADPL